MHPALSVIVFTVSSGLGYGLAIVLGLGLLDPAAAATKIGHLLALGLIAGGLMSSTLHLGNPQRAWRALSQWRSSWLSREGVMAVASFLPLACTALLSLFQDRWHPLPGLLGAAMAIGTVACTAMIYASLRSVQAWATRLTPACYLLFSLAGGFTLAASLATLGAGSEPVMSVMAVVLLIAAWGAKLAWRNRMLTMRPLSTPETATGLGAIGKVRLFEGPHSNENYLTREMGYRVARKHAAKLAGIALVLGGLLPAALIAAGLFTGGSGAIALCAFALLSHLAGMLTERWLFFAEAKHAVMNYY